MSKSLHKNLQAKMAALQGPEWDSSDEEGGAAPVVTEKKSKKKSSDKKAKSEKKRSKVDPIKLGKKHQRAEESDEEEEEDVVLYIGHLPKEFQEKDLIKFLSQFGKVYNCRIARKLQTGNSKGYAFVRFGDAEVSQIVCDTLHGYFIGQQRLVCQLRPAHKGMFFNTDTVIAKRRLQKRVEKKKRSESLANLDKLKQITSKLVSREQKKRKQLEAMGIEYDFPGYEKNKAEYEEQFAGEKSEEGTTRTRSDSTGSDGSAKKKKKRKDSVDSEGSAKKKKKRKNSMDDDGTEDTRGRSLSVESEGSSKKSKRKGSVDSESSAKKKNKKRKDSIDSEGSAKKKRKHSHADEDDTETPTKPNASSERQAKTAVKKDKKKKDKKRRESVP